MSAPESLPFELQPAPSPQEVNYTEQVSRPSSYLPANLSATRYISSICRSGPYPITRHVVTNPFCCISYIILLIATIVIFGVNYWTTDFTKEIVHDEIGFFGKIIDALNETLPQALFSSGCIIAAGLILFLIVIIIPQIAGFLIIAFTVLILILIIIELISQSDNQVWAGVHNLTIASTTDTQIFKIIFIIISFLALFLIGFLIVRRSHKLKHLGSLMKVVKIVLVGTMPGLPLLMFFVLPIISLLIWFGFTKATWNCLKMSLEENTLIPMFFLWIFIVLLWVWTHGILLATSDYLCQSWILHWYFNSNQDELKENEQPGLKQNWKMSVIKKWIRYHFGSCAYGAFISPYILENIVGATRKMIKRKNKIQKLQSTPSFSQQLLSLSRFCYIETIMECFDFCQSNTECYNLRQRIKQKIPQIYMLGHYLEQNLKIMLVVGALYLWFMFTYSMGHFLDSLSNTPLLSPFSFLIFGLILCLGLFYEISTFISHLFGMVSDTAVIAYSIDAQIERVHYHSNIPKSVPAQLKTGIAGLHIDMKIQQPNSSVNDAYPEIQDYQNKGFY